ncbi:MAG: AraC family transcriptional regulator [Verrucomicrobiaceae bacterium]
MKEIQLGLSDIHILDGETRVSPICVPEALKTDWLKNAPTCSLLANHHILHTGVMNAGPSYEVLRTRQSGTFFLACLAGHGSIYADGSWKTVKAGEACLLPPHTIHSLQMDDSPHWSFIWVRYHEPAGVVPMASGASPWLGEFDAAPLLGAIEGLRSEIGGAAPSLAIQHHWVELIQEYVSRFASPVQADERIWKAWNAVREDLGASWSLDRMAALANVSPEHFRRLCHRTLGRSPHKHLIYLRMHKAVELLTSTDDTIETIAGRLGYENPFAFSSTFLKWIGVRPSTYRAKR